MSETYGVGIIGAGLRGAFVLAPRIIELSGETSLRLRAIHDRLPVRRAEVKFMLNRLLKRQEIKGRVRSYSGYQRLLADEQVKLVLVTTPTYAHRQPVLDALQAGKMVYLDPPTAVTLDDSAAIVQTVQESGNPLMLGFTRRYEASWRKAHELVSSGAIGKLMMMQIRCVVPCTRIYHTWQRRSTWSGGALNELSSHHMDVFNWFAGERCTAISAVGGQSPQFAPRTDAPKRCLTCKEDDCPFNIYKTPAAFEEMKISTLPPSWRWSRKEIHLADNCVFGEGADIIDHAIANLQYGSGVKASLFFNIYGPKAPDQETFELVGTQGRLTLTRQTGQIELYSQYGRQHEIIETCHEEFDSSHFGADLELVRAMERFLCGSQPAASALDGHEALRMIHALQTSIDQGGQLVLMDDI